jgi:transcriptional regulator with PAS, ATPase and Fis domain
VALDCGAIPQNLVESELFGHERGAFTGADTGRKGAFEHANGGTIFLDELGELPLEMQPKLLRVIETREVKPVGASKARPINVRIIAATNRNLSEAASRNEFRKDLFYRLAVVRVTVPPLRERREDILLLARAFLARAAGPQNAEIPADLAAMLTSHSWPGNVRELRNVMDRYAVLGSDPTVLFDSPGAKPIAHAGAMPPDDLSHLPYHEARRVALDRFERAYLPGILARNGDVVVRAAEAAQLGRTSFHRILQRIRSGARTEDDED